MPDSKRRWYGLPQSLMGRLSLVIIAGVLVSQLLGNLFWSTQLHAKAELDVRSAAQYLGHSAASSIRFFRSLPPNYRTLLIQQFREMGGTRFFVNLNHEAVEIKPIEAQPLAGAVVETAMATLKADLPQLPGFRLDFAWPDQLAVSSDGIKITELPDSWVRHILLIKPDPAPVLVIQTELEPGNWLYLATLMPDLRTRLINHILAMKTKQPDYAREALKSYDALLPELKLMDGVRAQMKEGHE